MSSSFVITQLENNRGNGLIATKQIEVGELIFEESPFLWYLTSEKTNNSCSYCGSYYASALNISCVINETKKGAQKSTGNDHHHNKCDEMYCSIICRDKAMERGHRWLCSANGSNIKSCISQLKSSDTMSHLGLALHSICILAQQYLDFNSTSDSSSENSESVPQPPAQIIKQLAETMMEGFPNIDYCHSVHAFRNGTLIVDKEVFDTFLSPTYYRARLEEPQRLMKEILYNEVAWGGGPEGGRLAEEFTSSYVFTESFLKQLMGVFISCNLTMRYTEPVRHQSDAQLSVTSDQGSVNDREVLGTGLFSTYAKLNHSCECNTRNSMLPSSIDTHCVGRVAVHASRIIKLGEEITTTYLHSLRPSSELSVKERRRDLLQYLFICTCTLCESQALTDVDSNDDNDNADY